MLLINFSHPITAAQHAQLAYLTGQPIEDVRSQMPQFDADQPLADQVRLLVDTVGLSAEEWQTTPLIVNPPGLAPAAAAVLAELHGRMGYFSSILRLRPVPNTTPTRYEIAEIINLQALRDAARGRRQGTG